MLDWGALQWCHDAEDVLYDSRSSVCTYCAFVFQQLLDHFDQLLLLLWIQAEENRDRDNYSRNMKT